MKKHERLGSLKVNYEVIFSGNTFEDNVADIAIIENNQTQSNFYKDIMKISRLNNGAYVENHYLKPKVKMVILAKLKLG